MKTHSKTKGRNNRKKSTVLRRARTFLGLKTVVAILVAVIGGYVLVNHPQAAPLTTGNKPTPSHWLMTSNLITTYTKQQSANAAYFFNTTKAFTMSSTGQPISGLAALPVRNYKSYSQFASDTAHKTIPANVHWVLYDNESWSATPRAEAQQPAKYMKLFADLAHQHGLKVLEVPARDLVTVAGAACRQSGGETLDQAYVRCRIPADARYADVFEVQAQADQASVSAYSKLVTDARGQVKSYAPQITFMAGLTTDRGNSAVQVVSCWRATHTLVSGYWMNSTDATFGTAETALSQIHSAGG